MLEEAETEVQGRCEWEALEDNDLSGRPPIQLPDEDEDDGLLFRRDHSGSGGCTPTPTTTLTTRTFDSDAAPLHISTIQNISVSKATEAAEGEGKRLKEKEKRRQRRTARKAMKRLVEAGVVGDAEEFEGEWCVGTV